MKLHTKTIATERLILRPFVMEDAPAMYRNWAGDSDATQYMGWPTHSGLWETEERLRYVLEQYAKEEACEWAIVLRGQAEPIGSIGAVAENEGAKSLSVGYIIRRSLWHQGIASEALAAVLEYFFTETEVNRIQAYHDTRNPHSGDVMKKCGMRYEGTMRQSNWNNLGVCDTAHYGILRSDGRRGRNE